MGWSHYKNSIKNCSVSNVILECGNANSIGIIAGTNDVTQGPKVFANNTYDNCVMYSGNKELIIEDEFIRLYSNNYDPFVYASDGNGNYILYNTLDDAQNNSYGYTIFGDYLN